VAIPGPRSQMPRHRVALLSGLVVSGSFGLYLACSVGTIDYEGKACDDGVCPLPWTCGEMGKCVLDGGVEGPDARTDGPGGRDGTADRGMVDGPRLDGAVVDRRVPVTLSTGWLHTCLIVDKAIYCFGYDPQGQVSPAAACDAALCFKPIHVALEASAPPVEVAAGYTHTCALLADGTAWCWGSPAFGELGLGPVMARIGAVKDAGEPLVRIASGQETSCAVGMDGGVFCWGTNTVGQLGTGDHMVHGAPTRVALPSAVDVGLGFSWTCALLSEGGVDCWGNNSPTLTTSCDGSTVCSSTPVPIGGLDEVDGGATMLAVGGEHACAVMADSTVRCWGNNDHNQLGDGTTISRAGATIPVSYADCVGTVQGAIGIYAGSGGTCAVLKDATIVCWGNVAFATQMDPYATLVGISDVAQLGLNGYPSASFPNAFGCVMFQDGGISCTGYDTYGELGARDCGITMAMPPCPLGPVPGLP
jgi:alpha-tubulin suppressor-like RCC1 family protein